VIVTVTPWLATGDWVGGATGFVLGVLASVLLAWQLTPYLEARDSRHPAQDI
jgi:hypothetical protein